MNNKPDPVQRDTFMEELQEWKAKMKLRISGIETMEEDWRLDMKSLLKDISTVLHSVTSVSDNENNECTPYVPGSQDNSRNRVIRNFKKKKKKKNNKRRHKLFINNLTVIGKRVPWMLFSTFGRELPQPKKPYNGFGRKQSRGHYIYDRAKQCPLLPNYGNTGLWTN